MADMTWEQALAAFAPSTHTTITNRGKLADTGAPSWFSGWTIPWLADGVQDGSQFGFDIWWGLPLTMQNSRGQAADKTIMMGLTMDWKSLNDEAGPWGRFLRDPLEILWPLAIAPGGNDTTDAASFGAAADALDGVNAWLQDWNPKIKTWADDVDTPGSDWQGTAAGVFASMLQGFANELESLRLQLNTPTALSTSLRDSQAGLLQAVHALHDGYVTWRQSHLASPVMAVNDALKQTMTGAQISIPNPGDPAPTITITTPLGDPADNAFWDGLLALSRTMWKDNVASTLDAAAGPNMATLTSTYQSTLSALPSSLVPVDLRMPAPAAPDLSDGSSTKDGLGGLDGPDGKLGGKGQGGSGLDGLGASANIDPGAISSGAGLGADPGAGAPGALKTGSPLAGAPSIGLGGTGGGLGSPVLGADGKPVLGPDGKPITAPPGAFIGPNGALLGANGEPITGAGGKPVVVPKGAGIGSSGLGPGGPDAGLKLPPGSHIDANGRVTDANGKPVLDELGNQMVLPKGAKISPDGSVVDAAGQPITGSSQRLRGLAGEPGEPIVRPGTVSSGLGGLGGGAKRISTLGGAEPGLLGGKGFTASAGSGGAARFGEPVTGLSATAMERAGQPLPAEEDLVPGGSSAAGEQAAANAAEERAAQTAAEESMMAGRSMSTTGGAPMMPPMGGGAGAGGAEQGRQRTTWLSEDEEVWGTESTAVDGVIGR